MKRTLMLDEDDLIMVVKEDVVKQIDDHRGEMNRTEFVNYLIQCQLKEACDKQQYVTKEELYDFTRQMLELLHSFLNFFISYGMALGREGEGDVQALSRQMEEFFSTGETEGETEPF
jgi:hypothetical protein